MKNMRSGKMGLSQQRARTVLSSSIPSQSAAAGRSEGSKNFVVMQNFSKEK